MISVNEALLSPIYKSPILKMASKYNKSADRAVKLSQQKELVKAVQKYRKHGFSEKEKKKYMSKAK